MKTARAISRSTPIELTWYDPKVIATVLLWLTVGLLVWMQLVDPARRRRLRVPQRLGYMVALFWAGAALAEVLVLSSTPLYPSD